MSAICPVYPKQQTFLDAVGTSYTADGAYGFAIAESDDVQAMGKWAMAWNDLLPMDVRPALDDQAMGAVLTSGGP